MNMALIWDRYGNKLRFFCDRGKLYPNHLSVLEENYKKEVLKFY